MKKLLGLLSILSFLFFASCSDVELGGVPEDIYLSTSLIEFGSPTARTVIPTWDADFNITVQDGESGILNNYPQIGQVTNYEVVGVNSIFKITSITTYPYSDYLDSTTEIYYMNSVDQYVDNLGSVNSLYREVYRTSFTDDFTRVEEITDDSSDSSFQGSHYSTYDFASLVSYTLKNIDYDELPLNKVDGSRYYYNIDGSTEIIIIQEEGFITNLSYNGRVYKGKSTINMYTEIEIVGGIVVNKEMVYTITPKRGDSFTIIF